MSTTIGVGAASLSAREELDALVELSDQALFIAKESGRNRVAIIDRPPRIT